MPKLNTYTWWDVLLSSLASLIFPIIMGFGFLPGFAFFIGCMIGGSCMVGKPKKRGGFRKKSPFEEISEDEKLRQEITKTPLKDIIPIRGVIFFVSIVIMALVFSQLAYLSSDLPIIGLILTIVCFGIFIVVGLVKAMKERQDLDEGLKLYGEQIKAQQEQKEKAMEATTIPPGSMVPNENTPSKPTFRRDRWRL